MTSSSNTLRKSFGNLLSKVGSRQTLETSGEEAKMKLSSLPCYACGAKTKKNIQCRSCRKIACIADSGVTSLSSTERTCDNCIHLNIINELSGSDATKEKLSEQIQELVSKRDSITKKLNKESAKQRQLQTELKENIDKSESEKSILLQKMQQLKNQIKKMEEEIEILNLENKKLVVIKEHEINSREDVTKEAEHYKIAVDEMIKERTILLSNLNEVRDFIRLQVPVRIIKKIVCGGCYLTVQNTFANMFKHVVPIKSESSVKTQPKKHGACASCLIF